MGPTVPWHRTIPINRGHTSIYPGLHTKFVKAKRKKNYKVTLQNIYNISPPFLDEIMACKDI